MFPGYTESMALNWNFLQEPDLKLAKQSPIAHSC